jgi:hypothetical protein
LVRIVGGVKEAVAAVGVGVDEDDDAAEDDCGGATGVGCCCCCCWIDRGPGDLKSLNGLRSDFFLKVLLLAVSSPFSFLFFVLLLLKMLRNLCILLLTVCLAVCFRFLITSFEFELFEL